MDLTSIPDIWPLLATLLFLAALGLHSWRHRSVPGARPFAIACLFMVLWVAGAAAESAAANVSAKITWYRFQVVCQLPAATAMTCFALEYSGVERWLTRRNVMLLSIPPLLALMLALTNDLHHLSWLGFVYDGSLRPLPGGGGWILLAYGWSLVLVNITVLVWLFIRSPQHRWPAALMIFGQVGGRVLHLLDVANPYSLAGLDSLVLAVWFPFFMYAIALFGFHIFDPLPSARQMVIEQMREGMIVFDARWQVASLNPAAESILHIPAALARGKMVRELLPALPDLGPSLAKAGADTLEISLETGADARYYASNLSPLKDHRGLTIGYLLLLLDVTERHRAQAQVLAQQWAQATLEERELLADELHDGFSQNLAFLNLQAQTAQIYLQTEQREAAQASLARLAEVARRLQGDVREMIDNLLIVSLPSGNFCATLRQVLTRFEEQSGLSVCLQISGDADALCRPPQLSPAAGVQLIRIVQEALANVRQHAGCPSQISLHLTAESGRLQLAIMDDGAGFDPARPGATGKHFGLQVMRQRAARIGGQIAVHAAPGQGTRIEVCMPLPETPGEIDAGRSAL